MDVLKINDDDDDDDTIETTNSKNSTRLQPSMRANCCMPQLHPLYSAALVPGFMTLSNMDEGSRQCHDIAHYFEYPG